MQPVHRASLIPGAIPPLVFKGFFFCGGGGGGGGGGGRGDKAIIIYLWEDLLCNVCVSNQMVRRVIKHLILEGKKEANELRNTKHCLENTNKEELLKTYSFPLSQ